MMIRNESILILVSIPVAKIFTSSEVSVQWEHFRSASTEHWRGTKDQRIWTMHGFKRQRLDWFKATIINQLLLIITEYKSIIIEQRIELVCKKKIFIFLNWCLNRLERWFACNSGIWNSPSLNYHHLCIISRLTLDSEQSWSHWLEAAKSNCSNGIIWCWVIFTINLVNSNECFNVIFKMKFQRSHRHGLGFIPRQRTNPATGVALSAGPKPR